MSDALNVAVIGCGHVGSVVAACLAGAGHRVFGYDRSAALVDALNRGAPPFLEPGLERTLAGASAGGTLTFGQDELRLDSAEALVVCVDTPLTEAGADLRNLESSLATIAGSLRRTGSSAPVILKSTTPPGVAGRLVEAISASVGRDIPVAVVPEFLRQGHAVDDFLQPDRVVIGTASDEAWRVARDLFGSSGCPVIRTDVASAEFIKHGANAFLATRVSFINELADLAAAFDCDIDAVIKGIGADHRIGAQFLQPGIGFGGSCLPRDVATLIDSAVDAGVASLLLRAVREVNDARVEGVVDAVRRRLGGLAGHRLAVWGLTFKAGTEDTRSSPSIRVADALVGLGAEVCAYDPAGPLENAPIDVTICNSALECCKGAEAVLILTDWPEFAAVDFDAVREAMAGNFVYDARNLVTPSAVTRSGLDYQGTGRPFQRSPRDE